MEQARYWMWTKRKQYDQFGGTTTTTHHVLSSSNPTSSFGDSWEEQAFAEDAAGPLGGCIWPPRSYSCSFCRREFKSAQALGGHMNVHRRDRARLKQSSPNSHSEGVLLPPPPPPPPPAHHQNILMNRHHPSCTYLYNPRINNSDSDDQEVVTSSPSSPVRVSAPPTKIDKMASSVLPFLSSINHEEERKNYNMSTGRQSWSNLVAEKYFCVSDLKKEDKTSSKSTLESNRNRGKGSEYHDLVKTDLSVSLNLLVCRAQKTATDDAEEEEEEEEEEIPSSKRRRIDASSFTLFPKSSPAEKRCNLSRNSDLLKNSPSSLEDLDLELRLGDPPKVK